MAAASTSGGQSTQVSPHDHSAASKLLGKVAGGGSDTISLGKGGDTITSAGSATLHGGAAGSSAESVMSGAGAATLIGASGANSILGSSGAPAHGAFSFDTVQVGGTNLIGSFVSGDSVASGFSVGVGPKEALATGGQSQVSLDDGKTVINIKPHG